MQTNEFRPVPLNNLSIDNLFFALSALYQTRKEQVAALEGPSASSLKSATAKSYEHFCTAVEQAVTKWNKTYSACHIPYSSAAFN